MLMLRIHSLRGSILKRKPPIGTSFLFEDEQGGAFGCFYLLVSIVTRARHFLSTPPVSAVRAAGTNIGETLAGVVRALFADSIPNHPPT
jgi:hypothetical protein